MASRRSDRGRFDHGAQSFTARETAFIQRVRQWQAAGWVAPWVGRLACWDGDWSADRLRAPRWIATPRMSALPRAVLGDIDTVFGVQVSSLRRLSDRIDVQTEIEELGGYDWVVVTAPAPQAAQLCRSAAPSVASVLENVAYRPCWAAMVTGEMGVPWDGARVMRGPLSWVARQDTLPQRRGPERWVLHGSSSWSTAHLEEDPAVVGQRLSQVFSDMCGRPVLSVRAHRWRYARVVSPLASEVLVEGRVVVAGDACSGSRVEGAWRSGRAAAARVLEG